jgi:hypothetical protein
VILAQQAHADQGRTIPWHSCLFRSASSISSSI